MGKETGISWTDSTWNPWHGCKKVSEGCKFCYMYRDKERRKPNGEKFDALTDRMKDFYDPTIVMRASDSSFYAPLRKKSFKEPQKVFTCSWSDFFIEEADEWRDDAWEVIRKTPHLTYQILTKRPERVLSYLPDDWGKGYTNVWMGVTVENQEAANKRIPILWDWWEAMDNILFVSFEPLLGHIDLFQVPGNTSKTIDADGFKDVDFHPPFHWAIIGGESGNNTGKYRYRYCEQEWIELLSEQLQWGDVDVWVKQMGTYLAKEMNLSDRHGADISEWPEALQVQAFPVIR